ncbi:alginate lyase family protein [Vreelandella sp. F11]|uniref:alginate lyase family protein n=1 Tax=Vreelandella sp. F11 TaxID=3394751 RepID=UPI0036DA85CA
MQLKNTSTIYTSAALAAILISSTAQAREPVFMSLDVLEASRASVAASDDNSNVKRSYERLLEEASYAMEAGPFSVTNKGMVPPSGSRNDYMSISPYWWPDTSKEDGLPWIRKDGDVNPASKTGETDSRRIGHFTRSVRALALAGYFSQREEYSERAVEYLRTWFINSDSRMNPNMNYAQGVPGVADGRRGGIIDSRSLATRLLDSIAILEETGYLSTEDSEALDAWYSDYLDWLLTSELGMAESRSENNHGTWYDVQVASIAAFLNNEEVAHEWVLNGRERIGLQFSVDGSQPHELERTRTYHYSYFNIDAHSFLAQLADKYSLAYWDYSIPESGSLIDGIHLLANYNDRADHWPWPTTSEPRTLRMMSIYRKAGLGAGDEDLLALSDSGDFSDFTVEDNLAEIWSERDVELLYPLSEQ